MKPDDCAALMNSLKADVPTYIEKDPVRKQELFAAGLRSAKKQEIIETHRMEWEASTFHRFEWLV